MVVVAGAVDEVECPVMKGWLKLEALVSRAGKGHVALVNLTARRSLVKRCLRYLDSKIADLAICLTNLTHPTPLTVPPEIQA